MNDAAVDAQVQVSPTSGGLGKLTRQEAVKNGWLTGLPYAVIERVFDEDDFPVCGLMASSECSDGAALQPDLSAAAADMLANLLAQRPGIEAESVILAALASHMSQLVTRETLPERIARVQTLARAASIGPFPGNGKALMDDLWGE